MKRYRARYALGALCVVLAVVLKMCIPKLLGDSMDQLGRGDGGATTTPDLILRAALLIVGAAALGAVIRTLSRLMILGNSRRAGGDVRKDLFDHLVKLSPSFYVRHQTGHVMSRCVNDMQNVQGLLGPVFMYLTETVVVYAVGLCFMLSVDPFLTFCILAPFPPFLYLARKLAGRIQQGTRAAQEKLAELSAKVDESLSGQKVIKSLTLEDHDYDQFRSQSLAYRDTMLDVAKLRASLQPMMMFLASLSTFILLAVGGPMVTRGDIELGELISMIYWMMILAAPTGILGFVISSLKRGAVALERICEVLDMPADLVDPEPAKSGEGPGRAIQHGALEVRNLSVFFPALRDQPHLSGSLPPEAKDQIDGRKVLRDVSFRAEPGQTIGIVGATGSGKTTLLRTIGRLLEVEPGRVFIDGLDVNDIRLTQHRRAVGTVPQETFLFSMTLADNVALGRPDATREEIHAAVTAADLEKDLHQLPDGLDTMIGERGVNLSGGQRQRTALARVLLLQPKILLLDDTLSAVDTHTADQILLALRPIMRKCTTILVAHRVSTLAHADEILVLDEGKIVERGDHAALLRQDGIYASLHRRQTRRSQLSRELGLDELGPDASGHSDPDEDGTR
jgi:ATP-binding cassette subfamily B multidrug efflux pump